MASYEAMLEEWTTLRRPNGMRAETPAVTCASLFAHYPDTPSGYYYIDPNEGNPYDSFLAFCDQSQKSTCIHATKENIPLTAYQPVSSSGHSWYSELTDNGTMFEYKISKVQLNLLQLLSESAYQNVTYRCINSVAAFDQTRNSHSKAIKLMAADEIELVASSGAPSMQYQVLLDECSYRKNSTEKTIIEYRTSK